MYGMYKSTLRCPNEQCGKISITFDPFLMVAVSIPQENSKEIKVDIVNPHFPWVTTQEFYNYDKSKDPRIKDILQEKGEQWLDAKEEEIIITCSNIYGTEDIFHDEFLRLLKKKMKFNKKFLLRKMLPFELAIPPEETVNVIIHQTTMPTNWKKEIAPQLNFHFNKSTTFKQLHLILYQTYQNILKDFPRFNPSWLESADQMSIYQDHILNVFLSLEFKTNQRIGVNCSYCDKMICTDCVVPLTDTTIGSCLEKGDKLLQPEIHMIWKKAFKEESMIDMILDDWGKFYLSRKQFEPAQAESKPQMGEETKENNSGQEQAGPAAQEEQGIVPQEETVVTVQKEEEEEEIQEPFIGPLPKNETAIPLPYAPVTPITVSHATEQKKVGSQMKYTLDFCLSYSAKAEQLGQDNTWYCSQCKDHVQAFKTMEVYQAPKILMFHLKRFKDSQKQFKSKLQTLVEFPITGLDLKEHVLCKRLPNEEEEKSECIYDLYAICNHFGGLGGGHYTAYCKNEKDGKWYNFDDAIVTEVVNQSQLVSSSAYVLFYKRRGSDGEYDFGQKIKENVEKLQVILQKQREEEEAKKQEEEARKEKKEEETSKERMDEEASKEKQEVTDDSKQEEGVELKEVIHKEKEVNDDQNNP